MSGIHTDHTLATLRWRYADSPVEYRFLPGPDRSGLIVRLRQRGKARELVVCQQVGELDPKAAGGAIRNAMRRLGADHCIAWPGLGMTITTERVGPTLAMRPLRTTPPWLADTGSRPIFWKPGDIELF